MAVGIGWPSPECLGGGRAHWTRDSIVEVGSITEVFTALLMAQMIQRADPIAEYHRKAALVLAGTSRQRGTMIRYPD
jgi:hypothetical protein